MLEKIDRLLDVVGEVMQYRGRLAHSLGGQAQLSPDVADVLSSGDRMLDDSRTPRSACGRCHSR